MTLCASPRGGPTLWLQLPSSTDITKQCAASVLIHVVCVGLADHCLSMDNRYYALGSDSTGLSAHHVSRQCEDEAGGCGFGSPGYIGFAMIVRIPELCASASVQPLYDSRMHGGVGRPRRAASPKACQSESRVAVPANDLRCRGVFAIV